MHKTDLSQSVLENLTQLLRGLEPKALYGFLEENINELSNLDGDSEEILDARNWFQAHLDAKRDEDAAAAAADSATIMIESHGNHDENVYDDVNAHQDDAKIEETNVESSVRIPNLFDPFENEIESNGLFFNPLEFIADQDDELLKTANCCTNFIKSSYSENNNSLRKSSSNKKQVLDKRSGGVYEFDECVRARLAGELEQVKLTEKSIDDESIKSSNWRQYLKTKSSQETLRREQLSEDFIDSNAYLNEIEMNVDYFQSELQTLQENNFDLDSWQFDGQFADVDTLLKYKTSRHAINLKMHHNQLEHERQQHQIKARELIDSQSSSSSCSRFANLHVDSIREFIPPQTTTTAASTVMMTKQMIQSIKNQLNEMTTEDDQDDTIIIPNDDENNYFHQMNAVMVATSAEEANLENSGDQLQLSALSGSQRQQHQQQYTGWFIDDETGDICEFNANDTLLDDEQYYPMMHNESNEDGGGGGNSEYVGTIIDYDDYDEDQMFIESLTEQEVLDLLRTESELYALQMAQAAKLGIEVNNNNYRQEQEEVCDDEVVHLLNADNIENNNRRDQDQQSSSSSSNDPNNNNDNSNNFNNMDMMDCNIVIQSATISGMEKSSPEEVDVTAIMATTASVVDVEESYADENQNGGENENVNYSSEDTESSANVDIFENVYNYDQWSTYESSSNATESFSSKSSTVWSSLTSDQESSSDLTNSDNNNQHHLVMLNSGKIMITNHHNANNYNKNTANQTSHTSSPPLFNNYNNSFNSSSNSSTTTTAAANSNDVSMSLRYSLLKLLHTRRHLDSLLKEQQENSNMLISSSTSKTSTTPSSSSASSSLTNSSSIFAQSMSKKKPCVYKLNDGQCLRADCRFAHDFKNITCKYWLEGECLKGEGCEFFHGKLKQQQTPQQQQQQQSSSSSRRSNQKSEKNKSVAIEQKKVIKPKDFTFKEEEFPALGGGPQPPPPSALSPSSKTATITTATTTASTTNPISINNSQNKKSPKVKEKNNKK